MADLDPFKWPDLASKARSAMAAWSSPTRWAWVRLNGCYRRKLDGRNGHPTAGWPRNLN